MGKLSRDKGKTFERECAKVFRALYPSAKRTLTQQRDSGEAPDIEIPEWWVEAKHYARAPIRKAFEQAFGLGTTVDTSERQKRRSVLDFDSVPALEARLRRAGQGVSSGAAPAATTRSRGRSRSAPAR